MSQNEDPKSVYIFPEDSPVTPSIYDTRVRHLYLKKGIVSEEKLKNHLESLEDCSDLAESQNFLEVVSDLRAAEAHVLRAVRAQDARAARLRVVWRGAPGGVARHAGGGQDPAARARAQGGARLLRAAPAARARAGALPDRRRRRRGGRGA